MPSYRFAIAPIVACFVLAAGLPAPAWAGNAGSLSDLVDARASSGESDLESRGYTYIDGRPGYGGSQQSFYWNGRDRACVRVETSNGRFGAITDATAEDCHQRSGSDRGSNQKAAVAIVGAALIAAALASRSKGGSNSDDSSHGSEFDLGYNDGIHNAPYHNPRRSDAYSSGYDQGVQQRQSNISYHPQRGGYSRAVGFKDTVGQSSGRGIDMLMERGFTNVDTISSGNSVYGIFYNRDSRQCVQLAMADNIVQSADDIQTHEKCR